MPSDETSPQKAMHFEQSLKSLEQIVERMEKGDLSLEDSLAAFEQGVKLTRDCQTALDKAEQKVSILMEKTGSASPKSFKTGDKASGPA